MSKLYWITVAENLSILGVVSILVSMVLLVLTSVATFSDCSTIDEIKAATYKIRYWFGALGGVLVMGIFISVLVPDYSFRTAYATFLEKECTLLPENTN